MRTIPLLLSAALWSAGTLCLHADEVTLTTAKAIGDELTIAVNADAALRLTWGNGESQEFASDGSMLTIPVRHPQLTITTTVGKLTRLYVQDCGISVLDLAKAPNLEELYAADNLLATLSITDCPNLQTIDVQNNRLAVLDASEQTDLYDINVAGNGMEGTPLRLNTSARPVYYVVADNSLTSLSSSTILTKARTIWAQHNAITTASLSTAADLRSLCLSDNKVHSLTLGEKPMLRHLWVDNNLLSTIDMTKGAPVLTTMAADHNQLTTISWDAACGDALTDAYLHDNAMMLNSMPPFKYHNRDIHIVYQPMAPYAVERVYNLNEACDFAPMLRKGGFGTTIASTYKLIDGEGNTLVKGTDYTESGRVFTFLTPHADVVLKAGWGTFYTLQTTPFNIGVPDAIDGVEAAAPMTVRGGAGVLTVTLASAAKVNVCDVQGRMVHAATLGAGSHSLQVPAGLYVVNGEKVVVR